MAKTAAASAPHFPPSQAPRRTVRHVPVEERLSVLETQVQSAATKSDVRADVRGAENRLILWILGAAVALAGFFLSNITRLDGRMDKLEEKFEATAARLDVRMDRLDEKIDSRFDALMNELRKQRRGADRE